MVIQKVQATYEELRSLVLEYLRVDPDTQYVKLLAGTASLAVSKGLVPNPHQGVISGAQYDLRDEDADSVLEIIWDLVIERVLTIGGKGVGAGWPFFKVTKYGRRVLADRSPIPHDPAGYLTSLKDKIPNADQVILVYLQESLSTYNIGSLLSATISLGCASEKAVLLLIESFISALADPVKQDEFEKKVGGLFIKSKFAQFRSIFDSTATQLPTNLRDGIDIILSGIFEMIRVNRNDAGHPSGKVPSREQVYASLQLFIPYLQRIYALIEYYETNKITLS